MKVGILYVCILNERLTLTYVVSVRYEIITGKNDIVHSISRNVKLIGVCIAIITIV